MSTCILYVVDVGTMNATNCKCIIFTRSKSTIIFEENVNSATLNSTTSIRHLSVFLDFKISFNDISLFLKLISYWNLLREHVLSLNPFQL